MSTIDWRMGPEGAIGFATKLGFGEVSIWYRRTANGELEYCGDGSSHWMTSYKVPDDVVWREEETSAWTGEGLPPVGIVCEISLKPSVDHENTVDGHRYFEHDGEQVTIVAHHKIDESSSAAVYAVLKGFSYEYHSLCEGNFKAIRTPEQIAAEQVSTQLDSDLAMYGTSFAITNDDGSITRLDPTKIVMRKQEAK